jgi:hypothetical protein
VVAFQVPAVRVPTPVMLVKEPAVRKALVMLAQVAAPLVLRTVTAWLVQVAPAYAVGALAPLPRTRPVRPPAPPFAAGKMPDTPVVRGRPVALVRTKAVGVPSAGVTSVGLVPKTSRPDPVSLVTAAAKLADVGVPRKVAIPAPRALMPVPPWAGTKTPDVMFTALVVSVVAEGANATPPVLVQVSARAVLVQSPDRAGNWAAAKTPVREVVGTLPRLRVPPEVVKALPRA